MGFACDAYYDVFSAPIEPGELLNDFVARVLRCDMHLNIAVGGMPSFP